MNDWSHGYDVSGGYSHGFYREMAPDWLDLCAALGGAGAPRDRSSGKFRYLELGSGQGIGLCLLAAANPQAEFVGIDFLPDHVAHSRKIAAEAKLDNLRFIEADFLALADSWPADLGQFDYVTLHGIYTWVTDAIRDAVVRCLHHATRDGSLVYVGYNTLPGWLATMPFQHVALQLKKAGGEADAVIPRALALFERLQAGNALTFQVQPALKARLESVRSEDPDYLLQEYLNDGWRPMWHSQVAGQLAAAQLEYVATATIVENLLPAMLPPALREPVLDQADSSLRQDLQDIVLNQSFRRDIFGRGPASAEPRLDEFRLRLLAPPGEGAKILVDTSFGEVALEPPAFAGIIAALRQGPQSIADLLALSETSTHDIRQILVLMLDTPALAVAAASAASPDAAQRLNAVLARAASAGAPYGHLAAPALGSAIPATTAQMLLLDAWLSSNGAADAPSLAQALAARSQEIAHAIDRESEALAKGFLATAVPRLRQLGAIA
jgi:SAM-dependent methyltransferase